MRAWVYTDQGQVSVYTGTATLSAEGTVSGQFALPVDAPVGGYTLAMSRPGGALAEYYDYSGAWTSFSVEEYRKPDFQVSVTTNPEAVKGDPITAIIQAGYYFGGPLQGVTTTVNLQSSRHYFSWTDPDTGETYAFGEYNPPPWLYDYYYRPGVYPTPEPVQSFQALTDKDGRLIANVTQYITTTNGSRSVLIEGQVQDLSNQAVANSAYTIVHQGLYYIGLRNEDYIATAKQPTTITVRTVEWSGKAIAPNTAVNLRFVRREWAAPADGQGEWKLNEVEVGTASVTTDAQGRATYLFTPPTAGEYSIEATGTDSRGNLVRTTTQFYASDTTPGYYTPWRFKNDNAIQLVADKTQYRLGETARILVTSPFSESTALLTIERGHVRRYSVITLQGTAPTIDVPLQDGDLPNVYVGLTLLGPGRAPQDAPSGWVSQVNMRQGYVNLSLDTSGKELQVSVEPQGAGPFLPGTTNSVKVTTKDKNGKPVQGAFSLGVVDEAIYALASDGVPALFSAFWAERGLSISTSTSFTSGDSMDGGRGGGAFYGEGDAAGEPVPAPTTNIATEAQDSSRAANQGPAAPQKVRTDFRDTAFWIAEIATGSDGTAIVDVPFPDNLTTWRLTTAGLTKDTLAGGATGAMTVTQPLLLRPVLPRFLTTGDRPHPQAIIHNNTATDLELTVTLEVSGSITLNKAPLATQIITVRAGEQSVVTWDAIVDKGNVANFRFWVRTADKTGADYLEDAVGLSLPVKPFAAPEAVATSGEVQGVRGFEGIMIPYSVNPLLGDLTVRVSPSLAAATTDSLLYVKEYEQESTDATVSRFLPLVTLEKVYREQGLSTPYSQELPGIVSRALKRLGELQQPDGGWAWWERGPSSWFQTAYVVQGLTALRDAGYTLPTDTNGMTNMLQRGRDALRGFMLDNSTVGIDETYNLNMRAYTLYVLSYAGTDDGEIGQEATDLIAQTPRLSAHARAWLALALGKLGMSESKTVLDSLISEARQTSTLAHWEEDAPDYWSMGTDNRATALAIDALVTLQPDDPIVQKAVRWLMSAEREGHWLSSQDTSIVLVSLAHYMQVSKELSADYIFQVDAFGKLLGQGIANSSTLTQTTTFTLPVAEMPTNTLGDLNLSRSSDKGKMYYQVSLKYYVPGEGIKSRSEGLAISRSYYKMTGGVASDQPVKEAQAGDLLKVRLNIVVPETSYYVRVVDPLPAGLEGVNGSLNTTSFTERPPDPTGRMEGGEESKGIYDYWYWRWGPFDNVEMRDDRTVLFATYMSPGTYVYEYYARATTPGDYMSLPSHAELLYFPDVFGHSDGGEFKVR
ncbi:MAG: alpha-2-macroglobulin family protein [Chloroflexia bacterium]